VAVGCGVTLEANAVAYNGLDYSLKLKTRFLQWPVKARAAQPSVKQTRLRREGTRAKKLRLDIMTAT